MTDRAITLRWWLVVVLALVFTAYDRRYPCPCCGFLKECPPEWWDLSKVPDLR
jgi:hypothetical protein